MTATLPDTPLLMDPAPCAVAPALRRASSGDRAAVKTMHARCSPESRTARWRAPLATIPARYLDDALADRDGHLALLAECRLHGVVALASAVEIAPGRWELGVLVEDGHQRRGIGSRMTATLVIAVRDRAARQVVVEVGHDRRALLSRLGAFGIVRTRPDREGITGVLDLAVGRDGGGGGAAAAGSP